MNSRKQKEKEPNKIHRAYISHPWPRVERFAAEAVRARLVKRNFLSFDVFEIVRGKGRGACCKTQYNSWKMKMPPWKTKEMCEMRPNECEKFECHDKKIEAFVFLKKISILVVCCQTVAYPGSIFKLMNRQFQGRPLRSLPTFLRLLLTTRSGRIDAT